MFVRIALPIQLGLAGPLMLALVAAPPAHGRILLVPVLPGSAAGLAAAAIERGGRLVGTGPIEGSLVVDGDRARLTWPSLARGVVPVSGTLADCGQGADDRR